MMSDFFGKTFFRVFNAGFDDLTFPDVSRLATFIMRLRRVRRIFIFHQDVFTFGYLQIAAFAALKKN
jgi:hypothetical protein